MKEKLKSKAAFMLECAKCHTLNRVDIEFKYEVAKPEKPEAESKAETSEGMVPALPGGTVTKQNTEKTAKATKKTEAKTE